MWAPGCNAPLVRFLISVLYILLLVYITIPVASGLFMSGAAVVAAAAEDVALH